MLRYHHGSSPPAKWFSYRIERGRQNEWVSELVRGWEETRRRGRIKTVRWGRMCLEGKCVEGGQHEMHYCIVSSTQSEGPKIHHTTHWDVILSYASQQIVIFTPATKLVLHRRQKQDIPWNFKTFDKSQNLQNSWTLEIFLMSMHKKKPAHPWKTLYLFI